MIFGKFGDEAAQRNVNRQRTRFVNNTPALTTSDCHSQPTAMAVTGSEAEFIQLSRVTDRTNLSIGAGLLSNVARRATPPCTASVRSHLLAKMKGNDSPGRPRMTAVTRAQGIAANAVPGYRRLAAQLPARHSVRERATGRVYCAGLCKAIPALPRW